VSARSTTTTIIKELESNSPDYEIAISTTTDTGFARANALMQSAERVLLPDGFFADDERAFGKYQTGHVSAY